MIVARKSALECVLVLQRKLISAADTDTDTDQVLVLARTLPIANDLTGKFGFSVSGYFYFMSHFLTIENSTGTFCWSQMLHKTSGGLEKAWYATWESGCAFWVVIQNKDLWLMFGQEKSRPLGSNGAQSPLGAACGCLGEINESFNEAEGGTCGFPIH